MKLELNYLIWNKYRIICISTSQTNQTWITYKCTKSIINRKSTTWPYIHIRNSRNKQQFIDKRPNWVYFNYLVISMEWYKHHPLHFISLKRSRLFYTIIPLSQSLLSCNIGSGVQIIWFELFSPFLWYLTVKLNICNYFTRLIFVIWRIHSCCSKGSKVSHRSGELVNISSVTLWMQWFHWVPLLDEVHIVAGLSALHATSWAVE